VNNNIELFPNEQHKRYVTYAVVDYAREKRYWHDPDDDKRYLEKEGACLVFSTGGTDTARIMSKVSQLNFTKELFGDGFLLTGFKDKVVVATSFSGEHNQENPPYLFGYVHNNELVYRTSIELDKYCMSIAKFGGCFSCPEEKCFSRCVHNKVMTLAEKLGHKKFMHSLVNSEAVNRQLLCDTEDLEVFLRKSSRNNRWTFIKPGNFSNAFESKINRVSDVRMDDAEDKLQEARARHALGIKTSAAVKRCKAECCFSDYCRGTVKPYYGYPSRCQSSGAYHGNIVPGPFTEKEVREVFRRVRSHSGVRSAEEISQIAYNAGTSTYIFGYELQLCKMAPNLRDVQFVRPTTREHFTYSYEDAMTILRTPYRDGKHHLDGREYQYPGMQSIESKMSDDVLDIYHEACQYDYAKEYRTAYTTQVTPTIMSLTWNLYSQRIDVELKPGWSLTLSSVSETSDSLDARCAPLPKIMINNADIIKAVREEAVQETSQDKHL